MKKVTPATIGVPLGILIYLAIIAYFKYESMQLAHSKELQQQAWSQLRAGMTYAQASAIAEGLAWRRFTCLYDAWRRDVYLFGSQNPKLTSMLILEYRIENGATTLAAIGAFENSMLNPVTRGCRPEDIGE